MPALGIDLGGTKVEARLLQMDGKEIWRQRLATPDGDYEGTVAAVAQLVQAARRTVGGRAFTVGVGTPGSATPAGLMKNCNSACLNGRPLQQDLEVAIGQPIRLANDANCLALSEATDGAGAGADVVFAAILGTGTGAGIAVHGRVLQGPNGLAGEWGHNSLPFSLGTAGKPNGGFSSSAKNSANNSANSGPASGPRGARLFRESDDPVYDCCCGQRGCIETLISGPGIARDHLLMCRERLSGEQVAARAAAGDLNCKATMDRHARRLARALASVINLLDPDVIVLGGGLSLLPHLYTEVPRLWGEWVFSGGLQDTVRTRLEPSKHGDASGARGAAWLWWRG